MDQFAQTGPQTADLFNDDFEESMQTRANDDLFADDFDPVDAPEEVAPASAPVKAPSPAAAPPVQSPVTNASTRGRGGRERGRGRGRGSHHAGSQRSTPSASSPIPFGLQSSRHAPSPLGASIHAPKPAPKPAPKSTPAPEPAPKPAPASQPAPSPVPPAPAAPAEPQPAPTAAPEATAPPTAPTGPAAGVKQSVRGDRSSTGGTSRPKLSEEELSARLASAKLRNASLEAAHARAQADAANFAAREDEAARRRTEERRDRAAMMGEREKNRLRKLKAQGGREWDSEKIGEEEPGRGIRGANGGVTGSRAAGRGPEREEKGWEREYMVQERRGGGAPKAQRPAEVKAPKTEDFPALAPGQEAKTEAPKWVAAEKSAAKKEAVDVLKLETDKGKSWADMVED